MIISDENSQFKEVAFGGSFFYIHMWVHFEGEQDGISLCGN